MLDMNFIELESGICRLTSNSYLAILNSIEVGLQIPFLFMDYKEEFNKLLPEELETIKNIITEILNKTLNERITNLKFQERNKKIICPKCHNNSIVKNGFKNGNQRYKCKICNKFFSVSSHTITNHLMISYEQLCTFINCLINYNTVEETAKIVGISKTESYYLRIKILTTINEFKIQKLHEVIQCDEKYIRLSFKGTKKNKMPRKSHRNGFDDRTSGISDEQVCVLMAIDSYDNIFAKVVGLGPITTNQLESNFANHIELGSILITDSKAAYIKFAEKNSLILKQISPDYHTTKDGYSLGELNQLMSDLDILLLKSKGISTRHLQEYLDLFRARKILKYTFDYLEQNKELYSFSILKETDLITRKICQKPMPVNLAKIGITEFK